MNNKIKKWFENNKDKIFVWICVGLIVIITLLVVLFQRSDIDKMNDNHKADINVVQDDKNLNIDGFALDFDSYHFTDFSLNSSNMSYSPFIDLDDIQLSSFDSGYFTFIYISISDLNSYISNLNLSDYNSINIFSNYHFEEYNSSLFTFSNYYFTYYRFYSDVISNSTDLLINSYRDSFVLNWNSSYDYVPFFDISSTIDLNSSYNYFCLAFCTASSFSDTNNIDYSFELLYDGSYPFSFSFVEPSRKQFVDLQDDFEDLQSQYDDLLSDYNDLENISNTNYQNGFNDGLNSAILNERNNNLLLNSVLIAKGYQNNTLLHTSNQFDSIYNDVYKLTFLTSNIGYEPLNDSDYLTSIVFEFSQTLTINSSYFIYVTDLPSPNYHLSLLLDDTVVVDLNYQNDSLPLPITFNNEYTFNKIKLYNTYSQENDVWNISFGTSQAPYNYYLGSGSQVSGYASGYQIGFNDGLKEGHYNGYQEGLDNSYSLGYQAGYNVGIQQDVTNSGFRNLFNSILSYPINFISSVFNFEFMGINVASIVLFLVSIGVVLFVIKRLWK